MNPLLPWSYEQMGDVRQFRVQFDTTTSGCTHLSENVMELLTRLRHIQNEVRSADSVPD